MKKKNPTNLALFFFSREEINVNSSDIHISSSFKFHNFSLELQVLNKIKIN